MFLLLDLLLKHFTSFIQLMLCNLGGTRRLSNGTTFKCATQNRAPACICFPLPAAFVSSASASTFNSCFRARSSASLRSFSSYKLRILRWKICRRCVNLSLLLFQHILIIIGPISIFFLLLNAFLFALKS
jgi:hypothetical protein